MVLVAEEEGLLGLVLVVEEGGFWVPDDDDDEAPFPDDDRFDAFPDEFPELELDWLNRIALAAALATSSRAEADGAPPLKSRSLRSPILERTSRRSPLRRGGDGERLRL